MSSETPRQTFHEPAEAIDAGVHRPSLEHGTCVLGRYVLAGQIRETPIASVYRAQDPDRRERRFHVQTLRRDNLARRHVVEAFVRQVALIETLEHPGIVRVVESGVDYGVPTVVTADELSVTLRDRIRATSNGLPPAETTHIVREIAAALEYLHARTPPIVVRTLDPTNVYVTPSGAARLFQIAYLSLLEASAGPGDLKSLAAFTREAAHVAPEEYIASDAVGPPADQYCLASVVFECVVGVPAPVRGVPALVDTAAAEDALPDDLAPVLTRAWSHLASERYPSAREFAEAVASALNARAKPAAVPIDPRRSLRSTLVGIPAVPPAPLPLPAGVAVPITPSAALPIPPPAAVPIPPVAPPPSPPVAAPPPPPVAAPIVLPVAPVPSPMASPVSPPSARAPEPAKVADPVAVVPPVVTTAAAVFVAPAFESDPEASRARRRTWPWIVALVFGVASVSVAATFLIREHLGAARSPATDVARSTTRPVPSATAPGLAVNPAVTVQVNPALTVAANPAVAAAGPATPAVALQVPNAIEPQIGVQQPAATISASVGASVEIAAQNRRHHSRHHHHHALAGDANDTREVRRHGLQTSDRSSSSNSLFGPLFQAAQRRQRH